MNMFKKTGGFTLVELIVVIAILAILAGVAVPAYSGYIERANEAADITTLDAIKTAAMATKATDGAVTYIKVTDGDAAKVEVSIQPNDTTGANAADIATNSNFNLFYTGTAGTTAPKIELKTGSTATWTSASGEWVIAD